MLFAAFFAAVCIAAVDVGAGMAVVGGYGVLRVAVVLWRQPTPAQRQAAAREWHAAIDRLAHR